MKQQNKKRKSGFTLVELLVAMVCASLVLSMIIGTVIFMMKTTNELISVSEENYKIKTMRDHILFHSTDLTTSDEYNIAYETGDGELLFNGSTVVNDTELLNITFSEDGEFIYCELQFPDETYRFIVETKKGV